MIMCGYSHFVRSLVMLGSLVILSAFVWARTYTTTFPLTENPISEGGNWVGGQSAGGNLWGNVQTTGGGPNGLAFGVSEPTQFGDPTAILTGSWGPSQDVSTTVKINTQPTGTCCHEAELRLRMTISPNSISGYEVYCSVMPSPNNYCHIATWGGPNGSYHNLVDYLGIYSTLNNGDVLRATVSGTNPTTITAYVNGVQIMQVDDTGQAGWGPWTSGAPGMGFYDSQDNNWNYFGFSYFTATDGQNVPTYSCVGFQPPFDTPLLLNKHTNRAIPLKAQLFDSSNNLATPTTLGAAAQSPIVSVSYNAGNSNSTDETSSLDPIGQSSTGNQFNFDPTSETWWFNLGTSQYTAPGTYTVSLQSGDTQYLVSPQCSGKFVRQ